MSNKKKLEKTRIPMHDVPQCSNGPQKQVLIRRPCFRREEFQWGALPFHTSNEGKSTSALIAVELPSPLLGVASSGLITVALEHSAVHQTGN